MGCGGCLKKVNTFILEHKTGAESKQKGGLSPANCVKNYVLYEHAEETLLINVPGKSQNDIFHNTFHLFQAKAPQLAARSQQPQKYSTLTVIFKHLKYLAIAKNTHQGQQTLF